MILTNIVDSNWVFKQINPKPDKIKKSLNYICKKLRTISYIVLRGKIKFLLLKK